MPRITLPLLAALLVAASSTQASESGAAPLPCTLKSALGQVLGGTVVKGQIEMVGPNSVLLASTVTFPPFSNIEVGLSRKSQKIWGGSGRARFSDFLGAKAYLATLVRRFEKELPISERIDDPKMGTTDLYTGQMKVCSTLRGVETCYHSDGLKIHLWLSDDPHEGPSVALDCDDLALEAEHDREVME
jgi:hypothetical protein